MREILNETAESSATGCSVDSTAIASKNDSSKQTNCDKNNCNTNTEGSIEVDSLPHNCDRVGNPGAVTNNKYNDNNNREYGTANDELKLDNKNLFHLPPHHLNHSPVLSIRSLDSSIIESDSDVDFVHDDADMTQVNRNGCIVTKLNSEMIYPPNHPTIPNINSGLTLVNQKIAPDPGIDSSALVSPLNKLSIIGDELGKAQGLGNRPSAAAAAKIGSIAVNNSTDITFGDKHFYEGPVTIQQFLIDNHNKLKQQEENEANNTSLHDNIDIKDTKVDNDNSASDQSLKSFAFLANRGKYIIAALLFVLILIILAAVYGHLQTDDKSALRLVTRDEWNARPHGDSLVPLNIPVERVIVCHTASDICETLDACKYRVNVIQNLHMDSMDFDDIGYNFLLGSDGRIYEGRGWDLQGAHTKGYNENSLGIAFIGTFNTSKPNDAQLRAFSFLIEEAVRLKKLVANYKLYGARQFAPTESPGSAFYEMIQTWPHWTNEVNNGNI
uniref:Peptidoglycan recognition protein family domain-containing protein n=1 Tax=Glossina brevipalpis TaxID=37001 RepID=A0A1A9W385_9MUSC